MKVREKGMTDHECLLLKLRFIDLHFQIWDAVRACLSYEEGAAGRKVAGKGAGDVSYVLDAHAEEAIDAFFSKWDLPGGIVVVSEGLGVRSYPEGTSPDKARYRCLIDPIDGTRGIMYAMRSAWILSGIARNRGSATCLADIEMSLQTEIPVPKQTVSSVLWARRGAGATEEHWDIAGRHCLRGALPLLASTAETLQHGFCVFVNPFLGERKAITALGDRIVRSQIGETAQNEALVFHDEYISSAGQLYCIATGRYRLVADLRPRVGELLRERGRNYTLCAHPYDLCTYLVATESGCIVTDLTGHDLRYPMDTETDVGWISYANPILQKTIESRLLDEIRYLRIE